MKVPGASCRWALAHPTILEWYAVEKRWQRVDGLTRAMQRSRVPCSRLREHAYTNDSVGMAPGWVLIILNGISEHRNESAGCIVSVG